MKTTAVNIPELPDTFFGFVVEAHRRCAEALVRKHLPAATFAQLVFAGAHAAAYTRWMLDRRPEGGCGPYLDDEVDRSDALRCAARMISDEEFSEVIDLVAARWSEIGSAASKLAQS